MCLHFESASHHIEHVLLILNVVCGVWGSCDFPNYLSYLLVQAFQPITLVASYDLYHRFTYVRHTSYLVAIPIFGYQVDFVPFGCYHLAISPSAVASPHCQGGSINSHRFIRRYRWFSKFLPINNSNNNFLSHHTPRSPNAAK